MDDRGAAAAGRRPWYRRAAARAWRVALRGYRRVLHEQRSSEFGRLVVLHGLSSAADAVVVLALSGTLFFAQPAEAARTRVGLSLLLTMAPFALLSPVVGPLVDRFRGARRLGMIVAASGRAALALAVASHTTSLVLYPVAFGLLTLSRAHGVARAAIVPSLGGGHDSLVRRNARLTLVGAGAAAAASIPGILLLQVLSAGAVLRYAAIIYGLALAVALGLPRFDDAEERPAAQARERFLTPAVVLGARAAASARMLNGFLIFGLAFVLKRETAPTASYALVAGATLAGTMAANALLPRLRRLLREERLLLGALGAAALAPLAGLGSFAVPKVAAVALFVGVFAAAARLGFESLVQREVPEPVRGRAFARYETLFQLAWVFGAAIPVALVIPRPALLVAAAAVAAGALGTYAVAEQPARRRDRGTPVPPDQAAAS